MGTEIDRLEIQVETSAGKANKQLDEMIDKLSRVSGSLSGIHVGGVIALGTGAKQSNSPLKNLTKTLLNYSAAMTKAAYSSRGLYSALGGIYNNALHLARGFRIVGKSAEKSMDYIETYNYFSVTMSKIANEFSGQWQRYGYGSAEAYAESFSGRLNELTRKMSGYTVGTDGVLSISGGENLSLDPEQLMSYQANISAVTNSVGLMGETSVNTAKALSMLAADMSSLKNIDMKTVMTNFQSGLIGQSRALYKYGIDITNATLQTYAYKYGIETALQEMTQADKMQLRLLAILDQSKVAWGDQANTINSVANQYRIFKQQISNVARVIGNLFIPVLQAVLPVVNGILIAFQKLVVFVGKLLGIDYSGIMDGISGGYSDVDDVMGDVIDDTDNVADSAGNIGDNIDTANKAAKKLQRTLLGFDEINKLAEEPDTTNSGNSGGGNSGISGSGGGIDLSGAIADALANYESIWNKALENSVNKAQQYADKITGVFSKMWRTIKSGDYEGLGEYIAGGVDSIFQRINSVFNWERLGPGITKFVDAYCRTINSLVSNIDWGKIGKTIGDGLNVITNTFYRYLTGIDWVNIGISIATGLNGMIHNIDWDVLGRTIGAWIIKIPKMIYGFVTKLDWHSLGTGIGKALNGALKEIDGKMIAEGINKLVNGILVAIKAFIRKVDWKDVAKTVGDVLGNLDWGTLAKVGLAIGVAKLIAGLVGLLKDGLIKGLSDTIGHGVEKAIAGLGSKIIGLIPNIGKALSAVVGRFVLMGTDIAAAFTSGGIFQAVKTGFAGLVGMIGPWGIVIGAAIAGIIAIICNWDKVKEFFTQTLPNWWNQTVVPWIQSLPEFFKELPGKIYEKIITTKDKFVEWASGMWETATAGAQRVVDGVVDSFKGLPEKIGYAIGFAIGKLVAWAKQLYDTAAAEVPKIINGVVDFFKELPGKIWDGIISAKDKFVKWAGDIWSVLSKKVPEIINNVYNFFAKLPDKIWNGIIGAVNKIGQWCDKMYQKVSEEIPKIVNKVIDFFGKLPGKIYDIGKNLIKGFIQGIKDFFQSGIDAVGDFVDGVVNGFRNGFDVHSPSRVTYGIGKNVVQGFGNAIKDNWGGVSKNLVKLIGNTKNSISNTLSNIGDMGRRTVRNLVNTFSNIHIPMPHLGLSWNRVSIGSTSFSLPKFNVSWYANGGFPEMGELFLARESGPEMVGKMGRKSTVANNDQIVDGISSAVGPAVYNAVAAAMSSVGGSRNEAPQFNVYVGGRKVTDVVVEEINKQTKSTGKCPILV